MTMPLKLSLVRVPSTREQACGICGAEFVPAEDAGTRLLSVMAADQEPVNVLMCGGCHSKWSHGVTVTARGVGQAAVAPAVPNPTRG